MIDKINNINAGNAQNKRVTEDSKSKKAENSDVMNSSDSNKADKVDINSELNVKNMSAEAPIDTKKVSAIKDAISRGDYPIDIEKVADALLKAYKDIK